jgi:hypothetical protein
MKVPSILLYIALFCGALFVIFISVSHERDYYQVLSDGTYKVANIFMHEPKDYSFLVIYGDGSLHQTDIMTFRFDGHLNIFTDAHPDSASWIQIENGKIFMHIHSGKEIRGGSYKVNRNSRLVQTEPLEN